MLLKSDAQNVSCPEVGYSLYPPIFKQYPFLNPHISEKGQETHMENKTLTAFLALIRSYRSLIFQQNPFPNLLLSDPHRHTPAPTT